MTRPVAPGALGAPPSRPSRAPAPTPQPVTAPVATPGVAPSAPPMTPPPAARPTAPQRSAAPSRVTQTSLAPQLRRGSRAPREQVLQAALEHVDGWLWAAEGAPARDYLIDQRALAASALRAAGVGYLPGPTTPGETTRWLTAALLRTGFTPDEIRDAGLAQFEPEDSRDPRDLIDRPAGGGYVVLPVRSPSGTLVGMKFRGVPGIKREENERYTGTWGSHDEAIFGLDLVPRDATEAVGVEGEIDQLSCASARIADPSLPPIVGTYGKSLSNARIDAIASRFQRFGLMYDADVGGWSGVLTGGRKLGYKGVDLRVYQMPADLDPNELLQVGGAPGLARAIQELPRVSLLEAHALVLEQQGLLRDEPIYAARELRETAVSLAVCAPALLARVCDMGDLPLAVFARLAEERTTRLSMLRDEAGSGLHPRRVRGVAGEDASEQPSVGVGRGACQSPVSPSGRAPATVGG